MPYLLFFASVSTVLLFRTAYADIPEQTLNQHKYFYRQLIEDQCEPSQISIKEHHIVKVAKALAHAERMDKTIDLEPGLLKQMHKLLPSYMDCHLGVEEPLEHIMDSFVAFLAVNQQLSNNERRAYVQFAIKLAEIAKGDEQAYVN